MTAVYLFRDGKMLMLYRKGGSVVDNVWVGSAGGHFEKDELNDPRACVLREMNEELGLTENDINGLTLRYIAMRKSKGELRQNFYFFAELNGDIGELSSNEGELKWVPYSDIPSLEMPFCPTYMLPHYLNVGIYTDKLYGGIGISDGIVFTELSD